jgi:hypothetical protein
MGRRRIYPSPATAKVGPHHICCGGETVAIRTGGIGVIETSTAATSVIPTVISTMAMTPLGGFEVNVWLRTEGSYTIAIGTIGTSITPEITAMVAVTPSSRLDVTVRLKSNAGQDRDQRGSCGPASPSQEKDSSENEGGRAHDGVSAWKDSNLRNA